MCVTEMVENTLQFIKAEAKRFGAKDNSPGGDYVLRNNTGENALIEGVAYFGFIGPEEDASGPYHDLSYVIFPALDGVVWLVAIVVGTSGFRNDYELASLPGLRRTIAPLISEEGFCKSSFLDIETNLPKSFRDTFSHLNDLFNKYGKVLIAVDRINDPITEEGKKRLSGLLAFYAKMRNWPRNNQHRNAVSAAMSAILPALEQSNDQERIHDLLLQRRFVILEGPPGTGKTRMAKKISEQLAAKTFFTQFHAETSYVDFIYGIRPSLDEDKLGYQEYKGEFYQALQYALDNEDENVLLIIDEINRANLANVLGPVFYLFEYRMDIAANIEILIGGDLQISQIPDNLYVIATMNTADRSLAVVDFALRRRFAWYQLKPTAIQGNASFYQSDFQAFAEIFNWYAQGSELVLQPGQGYFLADNDEAMKNRIRYELYPLIKEYLAEGLLGNAKEEFNNYFTRRIQQSLVE